jgi:hypothetical protein
MRPILYHLFLILGTVLAAVHAFVVATSTRSSRTRVTFCLHRNVLCRNNAHAADADVGSNDGEPPIECFVIHDKEEKENPQVICTSEPDEYAWFNGIDRDAMRPATDKDSQLTTECVEGASPRGIPEWECKQ